MANYKFLYFAISLFFICLWRNIDAMTSDIVIGREEEKKLLEELLYSGEAELIAIYGRRRVGKTYLIRNFYQKYLAFEFTGVHEASLRNQLQNFSLALQQAMNSPIPPAPPGNWIQAFQFLISFLQTKIDKEPVVLLFDELPWIHTPKSGFLPAFGLWWNSWASRQRLLKVVICGSAASWMIKNVINDRGGLHNRVSRKIRLLPFTLGEAASFLQHRGIRLDAYQQLQLYMAVGGIPQYLKQVSKGESAVQAIDKICFGKTGMLLTEFKELYKSLFDQADRHESIVRALSKKPAGMSRAEIMKAAGFTTGGGVTELLQELEESGFITQHISFNRVLRDSIYKLSDEYSLFYLRFIEQNRNSGSGTWLRLSTTQSYKTWSGFAFEAVCLKHIAQIKQALGIAGVQTTASAWRYVPVKEETGAQIDLLIDRKDQCINLCEIKFSTGEFVIDKKYAAELDQKVKVFTEKAQPRKTIFPTMITTYGVKQNDYYTGRVQAEIKMEQLFT